LWIVKFKFFIESSTSGALIVWRTSWTQGIGRFQHFTSKSDVKARIIKSIISEKEFEIICSFDDSKDNECYEYLNGKNCIFWQKFNSQHQRKWDYLRMWVIYWDWIRQLVKWKLIGLYRNSRSYSLDFVWFAVLRNWQWREQ